MEEFINQMATKLGLSKETAEKVKGLLQQQSASLPAMLTGNAQSLTPMLAKLGIDPATVDKIVAYLKEHSADVQSWLSGQGGGILQKAKDAVGGLLGSKESK